MQPATIKQIGENVSISKTMISKLLSLLSNKGEIRMFTYYNKRRGRSPIYYGLNDLTDTQAQEKLDIPLICFLTGRMTILRDWKKKDCFGEPCFYVSPSNTKDPNHTILLF
jgi:predicted ArsR family transcriptional regulator